MLPKLMSIPGASSDDEEGGGRRRALLQDRTRFIVLALTTVCLTLGMCNGAALHFTVICMKTADNDGVDDGGGPLLDDGDHHAVTSSSAVAIIIQSSASSSPSSLPPIHYSPPPFDRPMFTFEQQGWLFSGLALGTLLSSLSTDFLCNLLGFRRLATLFGLASGFATFITPLLSWLPAPVNFHALFIGRLMQGFILALSFLAAGKLSSLWSPAKESTLFIGVISTHYMLGRMLTMPMAGLLCESPLGWPSVYYLLGSLTIAMFLLFFWFFRDLPQKHRKVSRAELARIESGRIGKGMARTNGQQAGGGGNGKKYEYFELLSNVHVWAVFISDLGIVLGNQLLAQYGPIYLKNAVGLSTQRSGFVAALPFLLSAILATIVAQLCDRFLGDKPKLMVILTTSCAQYSMAICYVVLASLPISMPILIQFLFILVIIFPGFWFVGIVKHVQLLGQNDRTQSLLTLNSSFSYFFIMLVPSFVNLFIGQQDETNSAKWSQIFLVVAGAQAISGLIAQLSVHFVKK